jgi:hypothetical protein
MKTINTHAPSETIQFNVETNQVSDSLLASDLHKTRKRLADQDNARLLADKAEVTRDITQVNLNIARINLDIQKVVEAVQTVKLETDRVIAEHKTRIMQSNVRLHANKANQKEVAVVRAVNTSKAQGVTTQGTDYVVNLKLPTFS